jgi:general secretion pathway protein A
VYEAYFGFREKPFYVTADPAFLYPSREHQEAMAHLLYGIRERLGFIVITGEVGTGKTTLAKTLIGRLEGPTRSALILNPTLSAAQLLRAVLRDFGAESNGGRPAPSSRSELGVAIEEFLLQQAESSENAVLIIDEAQALSVSTLEQVRLLSNVETAKRKLLQIVLIGQPELDQRLARDPRLRALQQRIAVRYRIQPLSRSEVSEYVRHRLQAAAPGGTLHFTEEALTAIARVSGGIPRRINLLCDQALVAGFVRESKQIDESMIEEEERVS